MKPDVLPYLCCPDCRADLRLADGTVSAPEIETGALQCTGCGKRFAIEHGVPVFVEKGPDESVEQTTAGFARNWNEFNDVILQNPQLNDELFRDWVAPIDPASFKGQVVLEPGCGMGRWLHVAAQYGPKALIGVDYSEIAYTAYRNVRDLPNAHVLRADIRRMPLKAAMDTIYCLGVVHHTPDPEGAFDACTTVMAPDGRMTVWVYGAENNAWITTFVDPVRKRVTSKLPHPVLSVVSKALAAQVYAAAWVHGKYFAESGFPYGPYFEHLRRYPFKYMEHIVYDHLVPEIANYIPKHELERWASKHGMPFSITSRNNNSWRVLLAKNQAVLDAVQTKRAAE